MKKLLIFIILCIITNTTHAQTTKAMWVGETYSCDASSATMGLTSDVSWTNSGGYISMSGSGFFRKVTVTQFFGGTATVTCKWKYRLTSNSKWNTGSKSWHFTCNDNPASIYPTTLELSPGETAYLSSSLKYSNSYTSYANMYYASSNSNIVEVTPDGLVTAKTSGKAYINLYSKVSGNSPSCLVTVKNVSVQSVTIPNSISIVSGKSTYINANIDPNNASVSSIKWYSDNESIATIVNGTVYGVKHGTTSVYCIVNGNIKSNKCNVTVTKEKLQLTANTEESFIETGTEIELYSNINTAKIFYTLDGTTPSEKSTLCTKPIIINNNCTLKAIACHEDYLDSDILSLPFLITDLKATGCFNSITQFTHPYIVFNKEIEKSNAFNSISLTIGNTNVLNKCIIDNENKALLIIPKENIPLNNETVVLNIPEGSVITKNGDKNKKLLYILTTSDKTYPYSNYATEVYAGNFTSSYLSNNGYLYYWGAIPNDEGGWSWAKSKDWIGFSNYIKTSCRSKYHVAYVNKHDQLYIWGYNDWGAIGDGETGNYYERFFPYHVIDNVKEVACGGSESHTLALMNDGQLYGWGSNYYNQLFEETKDKYTHYNTTFIMDEVEHVFANDRTSFVIKKDSSLWCWGCFYTPSRSGSYTLIDTPLKIADNAILVSSNGEETPSYITSNGTLYICDDYFNPIKISEEVVDVSGGYLRGMYVKKDGSLMSWGRNDCGQLGNGTVTAFSKSTSPQQAVKVMDDVTKVSTSWSYSLAIKKDGSVWGWGRNEYGNINPEKYDTQKNVLSPELIWESTPAENISKLFILPDISVGIYNEISAILHIYPVDAACKSVKWSIDDPNIISVDSKGIIRGLKAGKTIVYVEVTDKDNNVFNAKCNVTVTEYGRKDFYYWGSLSDWELDESMVFTYNEEGNCCSFTVPRGDAVSIFDDTRWGIAQRYGAIKTDEFSGQLTTESTNCIFIPFDNKYENYTISIYPSTMKYVITPIDPTGIETIEINKNDDSIYNLAGQKLKSPTRGINIIGRKKVLVR